MKRTPLARGSALLTVMVLIAVIAAMISSLFYYVQQVRIRAINNARALPRNYCADTGLQLARLYFANRQKTWNTYLGDPVHYNPVFSAASNPTPADPRNTLPPAAPNPLQTTAPFSDMFVDLDGDGAFDVFMYIRDNVDELPPAVNDPTQDHDMQVYVGAVCISGTLAPRNMDGTVDNSEYTSEALLIFNNTDDAYGQRSGSASGNANSN